MSTDLQAKPHKPKKTRSPNFPAIDLRTAISRVHEVYKKEHRHPAPIEVVIRHWGYGAKSSSAMQTLAALSAFGLVTVEGKGSDRLVTVSELALNIIEGEEKDRVSGLKAAALSPSIHKEVWEAYGAADRVSIESLKSHLIVKKHFNPKSAEPFIEQYKATISFANLDSGDTMASGGGDETDDASRLNDEVPNSSRLTTQEQMIHAHPQPAADSFPLPVPVADGSFQVVNIPKMTSQGFDFFKQQLEAYRAAFIQDRPIPSPTDEKT